MDAKARPHGLAYRLLHHEATGGVLLMAAALLAIVLANSPLRWAYDALLDTPGVVQVGALKIAKPALLWINDGQMAVFFLLVGLEIKRELVAGQLSSWQRASFPVLGAIGGMIVPALIFIAFNAANPAALQGWAIPSATDIAFALGVLALLGRRVPGEVKVFLLALAIVDDLGAILIIAIFYTSNLSLTSLAIGGLAVIGLFALNRSGVKAKMPYILIGLVLWVAVLKSGVHATLAGVITALMIPLSGADGTHASSPAKELERDLHPWVMLGIMPLFAFANAGVTLSGISLKDVFSPVPLGIAAGLFLGKQAGIFGFTWLGSALGICHKPQGASWAHIYGAALLGGIGFTMSLFIGTLAFETADHGRLLRIGVLAGSILSGIAGALVLRLFTRPAGHAVEKAPAFTTAESA